MLGARIGGSGRAGWLVEPTAPRHGCELAAPFASAHSLPPRETDPRNPNPRPKPPPERRFLP
jgi:hypothetical protein